MKKAFKYFTLIISLILIVGLLSGCSGGSSSSSSSSGGKKKCAWCGGSGVSYTGSGLPKDGVDLALNSVPCSHCGGTGYK